MEPNINEGPPWQEELLGAAGIVMTRPTEHLSQTHSPGSRYRTDDRATAANRVSLSPWHHTMWLSVPDNPSPGEAWTGPGLTLKAITSDPITSLGAAWLNNTGNNDRGDIALVFILWYDVEYIDCKAEYQSIFNYVFNFSRADIAYSGPELPLQLSPLHLLPLHTPPTSHTGGWGIKCTEYEGVDIKLGGGHFNCFCEVAFFRCEKAER